jgi:hypothetical protein
MTVFTMDGTQEGTHALKNAYDFKKIINNNIVYIDDTMATQSEKDKVIRGVYYDADTGFGSINDTYQQAKKILNTMMLRSFWNGKSHDKQNHTEDLTLT